MSLSPTRLAAGTIAVGALTLGLCGSAAAAGPTAKQLVSNAIAATESATSVRVAGSVLQGSQRISLNVSATDTGVGQGTIGIGKGTATVRSVGGTIYFMGTQSFWTQEGGKSAAQLFAGKWVSTASTTKSGQELGQFLNSSTFMKQLFGGGLSKSIFTQAGKGSVNGQPATVVSGADKNHKSGGKIYIASSGSPYVLRITFTGKSGQGSVTFSNYNQPVTPAVPQNVIDLDTLGSSSTTG